MDKSLVQAAVGLAVDMEQVGSARQLAGCRRAGSACRHNLAEASGPCTCCGARFEDARRIVARMLICSR